MIRRVALSAAGALFGSLAGAAALVLLYAFAPGLTLEMSHDRAPQLTGFYPGERIGELTFAWTRERADIRLPGLDRNMGWHARVRLRGGRQDASALPVVTLLVDGAPVAHLVATNEFADLVADIPAERGFARGLTLSLQTSNVFVPGPADPRILGVQVDRIDILPADRGTFPPRRAVAGAAAASGIFGAIFGLLGATATTAIGAATLLALGQGAIVRLGFGPFAPWTQRLPAIAAVIGIALLVVVASIERKRAGALRNTARFALMFTASALYLKLLVLLHPDLWLGNALFHAHRLSDVLGGHLRPVTEASPDAPLPYGIGLYLLALPFAHVASDHIVLLRAVAAAADAVACGLVYWLVARCSGDRLMAAVAVAITQLMPLGLAVQAAGDLSVVFANALALVTIVLAGGLLTERRTRWWALAMTAAALLAFLSHASTLISLALVMALLGGRLALARGEARHAAISICAVLALSLTVAVVLYYGRLASLPVLAAFDSAAMNTPAGLLEEIARAYSWPFLTLAVIGVLEGQRRFAGTPFWVLITSWLGAGVLILLASLLVRVDLRPYYTALPAIAICAAIGVTAGWRMHRHVRAAIAVLCVLGAVAGINHWLGILGPGLF